MLSSDLQKVFDFQLAANKKFACQWVDAGQHWYVCSSAFMCEDTGEPDSKPEGYGGAPSNPVFEEDPSRIYPENCVEVLIEKFPREMLSFLYTGEEAVSVDGKCILPLKCDSLAKRVYTLLYEGLASIENLELSLCLYVKSQMPMLRITQDKSTLYLIMAVDREKSGKVKIETDKCIYTATQWSDTKKCYNKIERKEKMPIKDTAVNDIIKKTLGVTAGGLNINPDKTGKELIQEEKEAKKEPEKAPDVQPETSEAPAEETKETVAEPVKRTRKKAEVTRVQDLTKIIEQLGGAVPDSMTAEDVQKEVRQLRDLLLAASRRVANVSLAYIDKNANAEAKLAAIKAAL